MSRWYQCTRWCQGGISVLGGCQGGISVLGGCQCGISVLGGYQGGVSVLGGCQCGISVLSGCQGGISVLGGCQGGIFICSSFPENIMTAHHYTKTEVETAAAAINAGTCLEDGNLEKNIFSYATEAVQQVCPSLCHPDVCVPALTKVFIQ